jgi:hypothetical protein
MISSIVGTADSSTVPTAKVYQLDTVCDKVCDNRGDERGRGVFTLKVTRLGGSGLVTDGEGLVHVVVTSVVESVHVGVLVSSEEGK